MNQRKEYTKADYRKAGEDIYHKLKEKRILYLGFAIPFMANMWLAISVTFISILLTSNSISPEVYFLLDYDFP